ncbi:non-homologous end-joining DNA ligase [Saccharomonospora xinjiangensis]|uniref:DNA ligase (ATP) n=1 Tax=Saccharomonospora xinjiangensis XJ-54 TaxID=882086 RepID=I0V8T5_9PSEU|nr:non-homologous end-joining DNA ligase [Saccharomonospora xinjiangensis]EID56538.1 ATP dependent DNA ligase-like protein,ATP dependent DNA ligase family protein [Saccharomonospora xinjiangensis XJ-54]
MLAVSGDVPEGEDWAYEWKWDGVRAIVGVGGGKVRIHSRNLREITATYPELHALTSLTRASLLLDGEIVTLDEHGRPSFGRLQSRMHVHVPSARLLRKVPVHYYVFDLLVMGSENTCGLPYRVRRERLTALGLTASPTVHTPEHYTHVSGAELLGVAAQHGLEGVVAKRLDSIYRPGMRSRSWVKTPLRATQEVVVGGWVSGEGRRSGTLGALLLGAYTADGSLCYVGHVGTGFTEAALADLLARLRPLARPSSPFATPVPRDRARHAHWVEPALVGEVEHRQWTTDRRLRHPSWRGLRPDRDPHEITVPPPA